MALAFLVVLTLAFWLAPASQAIANSTVTVDIEGTGSGEVRGGRCVEGVVCVAEFPLPETIECRYEPPGPPTGICETEVEWGIELRAISAPGSEFIEWRIEAGAPVAGCEWGSECAVDAFGGSAAVTAVFTKTALTPLKIEIDPPGGGTVSGPGFICPPTCEPEFEAGTVVTLTAAPNLGYAFKVWKGCDITEGRKCTVKTGIGMPIQARFIKIDPLTVEKDATSTGQGSVVSSPAGVSCPAACISTTTSFIDGATVKLKATPAAGSEFNPATGWTGCDSVNGEGKCVVAMSEARSVEAEFTAMTKNTLSFEKAGPGAGTVSSYPAGVSCGPTCVAAEASYLKTKTVLLNATPSLGSSFSSATGWSGCDSVNGEGKCVVAMSAAKSVAAEFE